MQYNIVEDFPAGGLLILLRALFYNFVSSS